MQKILKRDLILSAMNKPEYYFEKKIKKIIWLVKGELGGNLMSEFAALRGKHIGI